MLLPEDKQIAEVLEQRDSRFHHRLGRQRVSPRHRELLDVIEILRQFSPLISEHEKDERRVEAGDVLLSEILDVDEFDEIDEEEDLERRK